MSLIKKDEWTKAKGSLVNYLYTGIRNEMHNYLYKLRNEVAYDGFYDESVEDAYFQKDVCKIDYGIVKEVCDKFRVTYGMADTEVCTYLTEMGFTVINKPKDSTEFKLGLIKCKVCNEDFFKDVVIRLSGAVLWKNQEYFHL